ncbi:aldehyde dehydrogenase family protein [Sphingomonas sp. G-3-2-10]|uniref:aldehyde dehydrogenase family protein n=1 Tax=Sphingomonas sp. G-3-2-10 TaxID=2728838 RepID=UPI0032163E82
MAHQYERISGKLLIDGQWRDSDRREPNRNPSDLSDVVGDYAWASVAQAEEALAAARRALPGWSRSNVQFRSDILRRAGDAILARADALALLLAREEGKLLRDARGEVMRAAQICHFFSGECLRPPGRFLPGLRDGFNVIVEHEAVGVVALITPWNFPIAIPAWKAAAALAFGNTLVLKPSEITPGCAVALAEILIEAGLPAGVFNLVNGAGVDLGETLIDGADAVSFTGATPTGRKVLERAARTMTKVQLELGGKSPLVVLGDADLDQAVDAALDGAFRQTGQRCTASSRLIVVDELHDAFVERLAAKVAALKVGHALDEANDLGPVTTEVQLAKDLHYIETAKREGGELLSGGDVLERPTQGYYLAPALFANTTNAMTLNREEVFGPVVGVIRVADLDEAIAVACDADYALSSAICTRDIAAAERFRRASRAGMVVINGSTSGADYHAPFGGRAPSGYGSREQGAAAADFFTEIKTTYVNHGVLPAGGSNPAVKF